MVPTDVILEAYDRLEQDAFDNLATAPDRHTIERGLASMRTP